MSLLNNVKTDAAAKGEERDSLGGYSVYPTNAYKAVINMLYLQKAASGAIGAVFDLTLDVDGVPKKYSETLYITNAAGDNYFLDKKDQSKKILPSYITVDSFLTMLTGKGLASGAVTEMKAIKDRDNKVIQVEAFVDAINKVCYVAIENQEQNKSVKTDAGYVKTNEKTNRNTISKFFNENKETATEAKATEKPAELFYAQWVAKNAGQVISRYKVIPNAPSAAPIGGGASSNTNTVDLFGDLS